MNAFEALFLGIIQGLTEFLPVSSSGHLVLFQRIFDIQESTLLFNVSVHFATLIAVCIAFWKDILVLLKKPFCKTTGFILISMIPAGIIGVLLKDFFAELNQSGASIGIGFLITGIVLLLTTKIKSGNREIKEIKWFDALLIGLAQCIAIVPGISRSGMTLATSLSRDMKKDAAITFAFLMSIPIIAGGFILEIKDVIDIGVENINYFPIIIGMIAAFVAGYLSIKLFIATVKKGKIHYFAFYVLALSLLVFADQLFFNKIF